MAAKIKESGNSKEVPGMEGRTGAQQDFVVEQATPIEVVKFLEEPNSRNFGRVLSVLWNSTKGELNFIEATEMLKRAKYEEDKKLEIASQILEAVFSKNPEIIDQTRKAAIDYIQDWLEKKGQQRKELVQPFMWLINEIKTAKSNLSFIGMFASVTTRYGDKKGKAIVRKILEAKLKVNKNFFKAVETVRDPTKTDVYLLKRLTVAVSKDENPELERAARSKLGEIGADIMIQQKKKGNIDIFIKRERLPDRYFDEIAAAIRLEEILIRRSRLETDYRILTLPGQLDQVPNWKYYLGKRQVRFLNEGEPTKIDLKNIEEILAERINWGERFIWKRYINNCLNYYARKV